MAIKARQFTVQPSIGSGPRSARRVFFNSDALKSAKLSTGDYVALSGGLNSSEPFEAVCKIVFL